MMTYDEQIALYKKHLRIIKADRDGKVERGDDHGVMDCAADIREIKAEMKGYRKGYKQAKIDWELSEFGKTF